MKRTGFLWLGLAGGIAILCCLRERATSGQLVVETARSGTATGRSISSPSTAPHASLDLLPERVSQKPLDDTLTLIRLKMDRLSALPKAGKEGEDDLMRELAGILTDANAAEITRALSGDELQSRFGLTALQHWLKVDALAASVWVAARADASYEQAEAVAQQLAGDSAALNLYCTRLPDSAWSEAFLKQAALAAMRKDPVEAMQLAQRINSGGAQLDLLQTTVCTWMISNPAAAADWIEQVRDPLLKEELVSIGARTLAASDPLGAIDWLLSSLPVSSEGSESLLNETFQDIFTTWAETAPEQAGRAVAQLPQGDIRETTLNAVWRSWLRRDPGAAVEWAKNLPEGERIRAIASTN